MNVTSTAIYGSISKELAQVEERLKQTASVSFSSLSRYLDHILDRGGKRVRPALTLLASKFYPASDPERPIFMATAVEMLHLATLIHDDTVDNAPVRRGRPTLSSLFGQRTAVLVGDYIFAKSATFVCDTKDIRVVRIFAETIMHLSSGELRESCDAFDWRQTREHYFQRIFEKTASLFQTAAETGAILSGAPEEAVQRLRAFGYNIGMAFQVIDDILDFQGSEAEVGKPVGSDLLQGTVTLPLILLLEKGTEDGELDGLLNGSHDPECLQRLAKRIQGSSLIQESYVLAKSFVEKAHQELDQLPHNPAKEALLHLSNYVLERRK